MAEITITIREAVKQSIKSQRRVKRAMINTVLAVPGARQALHNRIKEQLAEDPAAESLKLYGTVQATGFGSRTAFRIDIDQLEQLFELLAKWIPIFISLFSGKVAAFVLAVALLGSSTATAQTVCVDGKCYRPAPVVNVLRTIAPDRVISTVEVEQVTTMTQRTKHYARRTRWQWGAWWQGSRVNRLATRAIRRNRSR